MPNYYTLFSFEITGLTPEERDWLRPLTEPEAPSNPEVAALADDEHLDFAAEFQDDGSSVWIHSEENGSPHDAADVVQAFLARFRPHDRVGFEWATGCSRPLLGAYGGGAVLVSATGQRWMSSDGWLAQQDSSELLEADADTAVRRASITVVGSAVFRCSGCGCLFASDREGTSVDPTRHQRYERATAPDPHGGDPQPGGCVSPCPCHDLAYRSQTDEPS